MHTPLRNFLLPLFLSALLLCGCQKKPYSQSTPDDVLKSAQKMIEKGEPRKLEQLIYAENPEMRKVITRMGRLFGSLGDLALNINTAFPKDVEELKKTATSGGLSQIMGQFSQARRRPPQGGEDMSDMFGDTLKQFFVDPYSWLKDNSGRLTTAPIDDNTVALMWDGNPLLAPLGVIMKRDQGKWYLVLPTNAPIVSQYMPRTPNEYLVFEKLIVVMDNAVKDLSKDVKEGKVADLNEVSRAAGEKAFVPVAMVMIAYGNMMEQRKRDAKPAEPPKAVAPANAPETRVSESKSPESKSPESKSKDAPESRPAESTSPK